MAKEMRKEDRSDMELIEDVRPQTGEIAEQLEDETTDAADGGTSGGSAAGGRGPRNYPAGMGEGTQSSSSGGMSESYGTTRSH